MVGDLIFSPRFSGGRDYRGPQARQSPEWELPIQNPWGNPKPRWRCFPQCERLPGTLMNYPPLGKASGRGTKPPQIRRMLLQLAPASHLKLRSVTRSLPCLSARLTLSQNPRVSQELSRSMVGLVREVVENFEIILRVAKIYQRSLAVLAGLWCQPVFKTRSGLAISETFGSDKTCLRAGPCRRIATKVGGEGHGHSPAGSLVRGAFSSTVGARTSFGHPRRYSRRKGMRVGRGEIPP